MKAICVSGTPGTGKTTLAKKLATELDCSYVDVAALIKKEDLDTEFDAKRKAASMAAIMK